MSPGQAYDRFIGRWEPFTNGVGPAGSYVATLDPEGQAALRERCRGPLPSAPFVLAARALGNPRPRVMTTESPAGDARQLRTPYADAQRAPA